MDAMLDVTFYGVRGSTPCPCDANARYGGNTSCVVVDVPGGDPILLDLGTGLRFYGFNEHCAHDPFRGTALVSHLHWDHIQGLPFFAPINCPDARLDVYGPRNGRTLEACFEEFMAPPYFPIGFRDLAGEIEFHDVDAGSFAVGPATVTVAAVPHVGTTNGYRIDWNGVSIAYVSDHQEPVGEPARVDEAVLALADGVDVLIHDAQFTPDEFVQRPDWGHCTVGYAVEVAHQAGVGELVLFHHDPGHCDATVDGLLEEAQAAAEGRNVGVVSAAAEGRTISLVPAGS
jgi:phosphoribosyl 1,2-cyclic phosphodiesterase